MSTNNEPQAPRPTRRNLNIASPPDSALDRIAILYDGQDLNANVAAILDRYLTMLHRATPKFSDLEICVVIDALGDNWEPTPANVSQIPREVLTAIITDRLDAKWGIDTDKFSARLDRTSFYERLTLGEITAAYWRMATTDSRPQDIINQIKRLIRPASSRITPTVRPRRISAHLFHQDPPASSGPGADAGETGNTTTDGDTERPGTGNAENYGTGHPGTEDGDTGHAGDTEGQLSTATGEETSDTGDGHLTDDTGDTGDTGDGEDGDTGADTAGQPDPTDSPQDPLL